MPGICYPAAPALSGSYDDSCMGELSRSQPPFCVIFCVEKKHTGMRFRLQNASILFTVVVDIHNILVVVQQQQSP